ncbi:voltage-gated chloride channel protein, partial [Clostridium perfringens]
MIKKWFEGTEKWPYALLSGYFIKWIVLGSVVGLMTGSASALFLYSLDYVT